MFIVCVTGTLAVISHEVDWLINSKLRIEAQSNQAIDWEAMYANIQREYPNNTSIALNAPLYSNFASIATVNDAERGMLRVFVNPYTGEVQGDAAWYASFQRVVRDLHRYLLAPKGGIYLVGPLGVILLISTITALFFYKRWWRGFFKIRLNNGSRAFWGSLHKVIGLWSLWFLLLIGITGTWYLVEGIMSDAGMRIQHERVLIDEDVLSKRPFMVEHIPVSEVITIATQQFEHFSPNIIVIPRNQTSPIYVGGYADALLSRPRANAVYIDPVSGDVLNVITTKGASALLNWVDMADSLHFGNFAGLVVKLIWLVFGVLLCMMSASGIVVFVKRIQNRRDEGWVKTILGGARFLTYILLLVPLIFGSTIWLYSQNAIAFVLQEQEVLLLVEGDGEFPSATMYIGTKDENTVVHVSFNCASACLPKKHRLELVFSNGDAKKFKSGFSGFRGAPSAVFATSKVPTISHVSVTMDNQEVFQLKPTTRITTDE